MNIGDTITIPVGKEKNSDHSGVAMIIDAISGNDYALKMANGTIVHYSKEDLTVPISTSSFPKPEVLEVIVDHKQKQPEGPTAFSFSKPQEVQKDIAAPTKIDVQQKTPTVQEIKDQIKREETPNANAEYQDFYDGASMLVDGWTLSLASALNWWAQDTAMQAYQYPKEVSDTFKRQWTKVFIKHNIKSPIELTAIGTAIGATIPLFAKAKSKRKIVMELKEAAEELERSKTPEQKLEEKKASIKRRPGGQKKS